MLLRLASFGTPQEVLVTDEWNDVHVLRASGLA